MYYSLPVKERMELMKKYKSAYPGMSYNEMVEHFNQGVQEYGDGGKVQKTTQQQYAPTPTLNIPKDTIQKYDTQTTESYLNQLNKTGSGRADESVNPLDFIFGGEATYLTSKIAPRFLKTAKNIDKASKVGDIGEAVNTFKTVSDYEKGTAFRKYFTPDVTEIKHDLTPYLSRKVKPKTKGQEVFESFLSPSTQYKKQLERTTYYNQEGKIINKK